MTASDPSMAPPQEPRIPKRRRVATLRTVVALMLREMSTRYGKNPGGYVWAILEPLGTIIVLSYGFALLVRSPSLGSSFLLFYATGYMPFNIFQSLSNVVGRAISFSKPLLKYPAVTWVDSILARFLLNFLTGILVTYLLITGILMVIDTRVVIDFRPIVAAMSMSALLGLGVGCMNCALTGVFPTWDIIWSIITRPLFIISGVIFIMEDMPSKVQNVLWWNPLIHITGLMRSGVYPTYNPQYITEAYVLGVALATMCIGLVMLGRYHRDILNS